MPRAWIVVLGFVLSGVVGLGAYLLPLFQTAATSTAISGVLPHLVPARAPTEPSRFDLAAGLAVGIAVESYGIRGI